MSGFAGSDRAGERRRRRLAVEAEGSESTESQDSENGDSLERFFAGTGTEAGGLSSRECPITNVIATQAWKHWVAGAICLLVGLGLLIASHTHPQWATNLGPGIPRLLKISSSPVLSWVNSVSLFVAAQIAVLIFWARSQSLRDFDGRFRIWGWAAATWLLLSFSVATQAHQAWSETILHHFHWRETGAAMWCWLVPASIWGWALALRLEQDMREDRAGHSVFLLACAWNLTVVGLLCQREFWAQTISPGLSQLLLAATQFLGAIFLLLSMSLHARYVMYFSVEPPSGKRRGGSQLNKSSELVPASNSLFQRLLPHWMTGVKMPRDVGEAESDEDGTGTGRKRAAPKKKSTARKTPRRSKSDDSDDPGSADIGDAIMTSEVIQPPEGGSAKKTFRVDKP